MALAWPHKDRDVAAVTQNPGEVGGAGREGPPPPGGARRMSRVFCRVGGTMMRNPTSLFHYFMIPSFIISFNTFVKLQLCGTGHLMDLVNTS